jgi:hypothetical protein
MSFQIIPIRDSLHFLYVWTETEAVQELVDIY